MAHLHQTDGAQVLSVWHNGGMTGYHGRKRAKRPRDFSQAAKLVVDIASGQVEDRPPTAIRGQAGGLKGGPAGLPLWIIEGVRRSLEKRQLHGGRRDSCRLRQQ
jgi:hypothetical protein